MLALAASILAPTARHTLAVVVTLNVVVIAPIFALFFALALSYGQLRELRYLPLYFPFKMARRLAKFERRRYQGICRTDRLAVEVQRADLDGVWLAEHVPWNRQPNHEVERPQRARDLTRIQRVNASAVDIDLAVRRHNSVVAQGEDAHRHAVLELPGCFLFEFHRMGSDSVHSARL